MDKYVVFMKSQLRELLVNYGPIDVLWFDGNWEPSWTDERGKDLERFLRDIQPNLIINNRVARVCPDHISQGYPRGDFDTPEQMVPPSKLAREDWESCLTMNDHWQYMAEDQNWKSAATLIRLLVDTASKGGNLLLDVGPQPDGVFPPAAIERLDAIGGWMRVNGESIYGTKAGPFGKAFPWGRCTSKVLADGRTRLYLHVFEWPADGKLTFLGLKGRVWQAYLLADPQRTALHVTGGSEGLTTIAVPASAPDGAVSVVVLELDPEAKPVGKSE
jgi:alpha-L-fucosidase